MTCHAVDDVSEVAHRTSQSELPAAVSSLGNEMAVRGGIKIFFVVGAFRDAERVGPAGVACWGTGREPHPPGVELPWSAWRNGWGCGRHVGGQVELRRNRQCRPLRAVTVGRFLDSVLGAHGSST